MAGVISILVVTVVSFIIVRIGATALEMTGLSREAARFQAVSAFFGAGFTTGESELVVNHPIRRRVIRDLIIIGQIGLTTVLATAVITFVGQELTPLQGLARLGLVGAVLVVLWALSRSRVTHRVLDASIRATLRRAGVVHAMDYERLLGVQHGFAISEVTIEPGHWLAGKSLAEAVLRGKGVVVLAVTRTNGEFVGAAHGDTRIEAGDTLLVYALESRIKSFAGGDR